MRDLEKDFVLKYMGEQGAKEYFSVLKEVGFPNGFSVGSGLNKVTQMFFKKGYVAGQKKKKGEKT